MGYLRKGSLRSLVTGTGFGGAISALGYSAFLKFKANQSDVSEIQSSLICSSMLAVMMLRVALQAKKFMPPGMISLISLGASAFYVYRLAAPNMPRLEL